LTVTKTRLENLDKTKKTTWERWIEVKSTRSKEPHSAYFSGDQFKAMLDCNKDGRGYSIYRVFNAGDANGATIEKIKDPFNKIMEGVIPLHSIKPKI